MCSDLFARPTWNWGAQLSKCHCLKSVSLLSSAHLSQKFLILSRNSATLWGWQDPGKWMYFSAVACWRIASCNAACRWRICNLECKNRLKKKKTKKPQPWHVLYKWTGFSSPLLSWRIVLCLSLIAISWQGRQAGLSFGCLETWILWGMLVICSCQKGHRLQVWALRAQELLWEGAHKLLCLQLSEEKGQESCAEGCGRLCTSKPAPATVCLIRRLCLMKKTHTVLSFHCHYPPPGQLSCNADAKGASLWGGLWPSCSRKSKTLRQCSL